MLLAVRSISARGGWARGLGAGLSGWWATGPGGPPGGHAAFTSQGSDGEAGGLPASDRMSAGTVGRSDGTSPRFYKEVGVVRSEEYQGWQVTLDGRILKTPLRKPLVLPTYALALGVAAEWEWQDSKDLRPFMMPMMTLSVTAVDQIPSTRLKVTNTLLRYFHTDMVFCREEATSPLAARQAVMWDPLVSWVSKRLDAPVSISDSIFGVEQPEAAVEALRRYLDDLDDWELAGVDSLAAAGRSVVISLAAAEGRVGVAEAIRAARLEDDYQIEEWGLVEGGHDIDQADIDVRMAAPSLFLRLLAERGADAP